MIQKQYQQHGALVVIKDNTTYKGWLPDDLSAAKTAIAETNETSISTESEVQNIIDKNQLPPIVSKSTAKNIKENYKSLTSK